MTGKLKRDCHPPCVWESGSGGQKGRCIYRKTGNLCGGRSSSPQPKTVVKKETVIKEVFVPSTPPVATSHAQQPIYIVQNFGGGFGLPQGINPIAVGPTNEEDDDKHKKPRNDDESSEEDQDEESFRKKPKKKRSKKPRKQDEDDDEDEDAVDRTLENITFSPTITVSPTISPTASPTMSPTVAPTISPTASPTMSPTASPTVSPTVAPTISPTASPTMSPTISPTASPTMSPTVAPTISPTNQAPNYSAPTYPAPPQVPQNIPQGAPQVIYQPVVQPVMPQPPVYQQPVYQQPVYQPPVYQQPVYQPEAPLEVNQEQILLVEEQQQLSDEISRSFNELRSDFRDLSNYVRNMPRSNGVTKEELEAALVDSTNFLDQRFKDLLEAQTKDLTQMVRKVVDAVANSTNQTIASVVQNKGNELVQAINKLQLASAPVDQVQIIQQVETDFKKLSKDLKKSLSNDLTTLKNGLVDQLDLVYQPLQQSLNELQIKLQQPPVKGYVEPTELTNILNELKKQSQAIANLPTALSRAVSDLLNGITADLSELKTTLKNGGVSPKDLETIKNALVDEVQNLIRTIEYTVTGAIVADTVTRITKTETNIKKLVEQIKDKIPNNLEGTLDDIKTAVNNLDIASKFQGLTKQLTNVQNALTNKIDSIKTDVAEQLRTQRIDLEEQIKRLQQATMDNERSKAVAKPDGDNIFDPSKYLQEVYNNVSQAIQDQRLVHEKNLQKFNDEQKKLQDEADQVRREGDKQRLQAIEKATRDSEFATNLLKTQQELLAKTQQALEMSLMNQEQLVNAKNILDNIVTNMGVVSAFFNPELESSINDTINRIGTSFKNVTNQQVKVENSLLELTKAINELKGQDVTLKDERIKAVKKLEDEVKSLKEKVQDQIPKAITAGEKEQQEIVDTVVKNQLEVFEKSIIGKLQDKLDDKVNNLLKNLEEKLNNLRDQADTNHNKVLEAVADKNSENASKIQKTMDKFANDSKKLLDQIDAKNKTEREELIKLGNQLIDKLTQILDNKLKELVDKVKDDEDRKKEIDKTLEEMAKKQKDLREKLEKEQQEFVAKTNEEKNAFIQQQKQKQALKENQMKITIIQAFDEKYEATEKNLVDAVKKAIEDALNSTDPKVRDAGRQAKKFFDIATQTGEEIVEVTGQPMIPTEDKVEKDIEMAKNETEEVNKQYTLSQQTYEQVQYLVEVKKAARDALNDSYELKRDSLLRKFESGGILEVEVKEETKRRKVSEVTKPAPVTYQCLLETIQPVKEYYLALKDQQIENMLRQHSPELLKDPLNPPLQVTENPGYSMEGLANKAVDIVTNFLQSPKEAPVVQQQGYQQFGGFRLLNNQQGQPDVLRTLRLMGEYLTSNRDIFLSGNNIALANKIVNLLRPHTEFTTTETFGLSLFQGYKNSRATKEEQLKFYQDLKSLLAKLSNEELKVQSEEQAESTRRYLASFLVTYLNAYSTVPLDNVLKDNVVAIAKGNIDMSLEDRCFLLAFCFLFTTLRLSDNVLVNDLTTTILRSLDQAFELLQEFATAGSYEMPKPNEGDLMQDSEMPDTAKELSEVRKGTKRSRSKLQAAITDTAMSLPSGAARFSFETQVLPKLPLLADTDLQFSVVEKDQLLLMLLPDLLQYSNELKARLSFLYPYVHEFNKLELLDLSTNPEYFQVNPRLPKTEEECNDRSTELKVKWDKTINQCVEDLDLKKALITNDTKAYANRVLDFVNTLTGSANLVNAMIMQRNAEEANAAMKANLSIEEWRAALTNLGTLQNKLKQTVVPKTEFSFKLFDPKLFSREQRIGLLYKHGPLTDNVNSFYKLYNLSEGLKGRVSQVVASLYALNPDDKTRELIVNKLDVDSTGSSPTKVRDLLKDLISDLANLEGLSEPFEAKEQKTKPQQQSSTSTKGSTSTKPLPTVSGKGSEQQNWRQSSQQSTSSKPKKQGGLVLLDKK